MPPNISQPPPNPSPSFFGPEIPWGNAPQAQGAKPRGFGGETPKACVARTQTNLRGAAALSGQSASHWTFHAVPTSSVS